MNTLTFIFVLLVALEHLFIMYVEMFMSQTAFAQRAFEISPQFSSQKEAQVMMSNQGLYNGFIGVGIILTLFFIPTDALKATLFLFIGFVVVAAFWGALTASKKILFVQGGPAIIALLLLFFQ